MMIVAPLSSGTFSPLSSHLTQRAASGNTHKPTMLSSNWLQVTSMPNRMLNSYIIPLDHPMVLWYRMSPATPPSSSDPNRTTPSCRSSPYQTCTSLTGESSITWIRSHMVVHIKRTKVRLAWKRSSQVTWRPSNIWKPVSRSLAVS